MLNLPIKSLLLPVLAICVLAPTMGCNPAQKSDAVSTAKNETSDRATAELTRNKTATKSSDTTTAAEPPAQTKVSATASASVAINGPDNAAPSTTPGLSLRIFSWNVESEGADSEVIADQLSKMGGYDVYGLVEVLPQDLGRFRDALGKNYKYAYSKSGNNDRLQLLYNEGRFELVRQLELDDINFEMRYRSPLLIHLRDRATKSEFMVMVNHLARGKEEVRTRQAEQLVEWARGQTLPIFAIGDYNFDYVFATETGNDGFRTMLRDNIWQWIKPDPLVDTNWYDPEKTGNDVYPGSILDFAFVAGQATEWNCVCNVIVREGDFPDDEKTSDHRPFELIATRK